MFLLPLHTYGLRPVPVFAEANIVFEIPPKTLLALHSQYYQELAEAAQLEDETVLLDREDPDAGLEQMTTEAMITNKIMALGEMGTAELNKITLEQADKLLGATPDGILRAMNATVKGQGTSEYSALKLFWHQKVLVIHYLRQAFQSEPDTPSSGIICTDDVGLGKTASFLAFIAQLAIEATHDHQPPKSDANAKKGQSGTQSSSEKRVIPLLRESSSGPSCRTFR